MSLRARIAIAAAISVAAVALALATSAYLSTRSHLLGGVRQQLSDRYASYPHPGRHDGDDHGGGPANIVGTRAQVPPPPLGGAPGYFQFVYPNGTAVAQDGTAAQLPVTPAMTALAGATQGSFFSDATVRGIHVEVLTRADAPERRAIAVALPLSSVDSTLHALLITYALLIGGGILLAALAGALTARAALRPVGSFIRQTEAVTGAPDRSRRLEETGPRELARLAASFNQTLEALERSVLAQQHLIADASHELRTPMAALRSNIQIFLEAERLPASEQVALQESIIAELDELTQLVADVLELARGTAANDRTEPIELDGLVGEAIARTGRRAPGLRFVSDIQPTTIVNVPDRVARAVSNVIDNARKWSPPEGTVEVTLRDAVLTVRDHGPGFAPADLPMIFDRFYRADDARRMPGAGLGLAIVKQAAEAYGGHAEAGNSPGGGALVRVVFGSAAIATAGG